MKQPLGIRMAAGIALVIFVLELVGAFDIVVSLLTLRQSQDNFAQTVAETHAVDLQERELGSQVASIITYVNATNAQGAAGTGALLALLAAQCSLLLDVDRRLGATPSASVLTACRSITLPPPVVIPTPSPLSTPRP